MGDIVIDSSALLAILFFENEADYIKQAIADSDKIYISAATYTETGIVFDSSEYAKKNPKELDTLLSIISAEIVPVTESQAIQARKAYKKFGKGKHSAKLNMVDCFSYALAKDKNLPLLYKGNDFSKTDIVSVL